MAKNKDINISPSKGISIIIKNDIQQPAPIKPKKKRRYKRINVLPKTPAPTMQQSAGDTSYIKEQPGRFSLWRDNTTLSPVITLAQATTQGFIPQVQAPAPAPPQQLALPAPPQQLALPAQPQLAITLGDYMRALMPQEYSAKINPDSRFEEPNMSFADNLGLNDTFYQALPDDKKEEYQNFKLEDIVKNIDDTADKAAADIETTDFYQNQLDIPTQASTKEKTKYLEKQKKLEGMKESNLKGIATKDVKASNEARYPQNKIYRDVYIEGLKRQENLVNKRVLELDDIIVNNTDGKKARAEGEKLNKLAELQKIEDLFTKMKSEKKRIKKLLK